MAGSKQENSSELHALSRSHKVSRSHDFMTRNSIETLRRCLFSGALSRSNWRYHGQSLPSAERNRERLRA